MLYQDRILGRHGWWRRLAASLAVAWQGRRVADLDLLSMNGHLRRDLGLEEGQGGLRVSDAPRA